MKVCIIYGWGEGPWQGKRLRALLHKHGFTVTKNAKDADILIAHSGGCFMIPDESRAKLILLIGLPYWPGKTIFKSLSQKIRQELKDSWWYKKTLFNTFYALTRPRRSVRMVRNWRRQTLPARQEVPIILIRNEKDTFTHPTDAMSLAQARNWKLQSLPGLHDDLWLNPKVYVDVIKSVVDDL